MTREWSRSHPPVASPVRCDTPSAHVLRNRSCRYLDRAAGFRQRRQDRRASVAEYALAVLILGFTAQLRDVCVIPLAARDRRALVGENLPCILRVARNVRAWMRPERRFDH